MKYRCARVEIQLEHIYILLYLLGDIFAISSNSESEVWSDDICDDYIFLPQRCAPRPEWKLGTQKSDSVPSRDATELLNALMAMNWIMLVDNYLVYLVAMYYLRWLAFDQRQHV